MPPSPPSLAQVSITISVGPDKRAAQFTSPALAQLWTQVRPHSHPDHPFLDPLYSPNSSMPAVDFTPWVAERLEANDWSSILELLDFMTLDSQIRALNQTFHDYDLTRFIEADSRLLRELLAVLILGFRIPLTGYPEGRLSLIAELFQHCLASYPFKLREPAFEFLLKGANRLIRKWNREGVGYPRDLLTPVTLRRELPEVSVAGEILRKYPVTFRACITLSLQRSSTVPGTLQPRPQGEYGLRQYGLCEQQNVEFFKECGLFEPTSYLQSVAATLKKDELAEIAEAAHVQVTKSWKKDRIIGLLLADENARSVLKDRAGHRFFQFREATYDELGEWRSRVSAAYPAALCLAAAQIQEFGVLVPHWERMARPGDQI